MPIHKLTNSLNELMETLKIQEDLDKARELLTFQDVFNKTMETLEGNIMESSAKVTADFSKADTIEYPKPYLESIMLNLMSNALKYRSPERTPVIHFETHYQKHKLMLTVKDNGLGIDLKQHSNKFFKLNSTFHEHPEAKGVGLFIVKTQVEAMGGSIAAESEVGKGTTFTIVFNKK